MRANRRRDTKPERSLRSELHRRGLRFRVDFAVPVNGRSPRVDIAFTRQRVAVFVDGCFWHGCPQHARAPTSNSTYWGPKLARNVERDGEQRDRLAAAGWAVVRIWEHENVGAAADRVVDAITASAMRRPAANGH